MRGVSLLTGSNYDLLLLIFQHLKENRVSLFKCSLVNREFSQAAARTLYAEVMIAPPFRAFLDLKDKDGANDLGQFLSSTLPKNAGYVLALTVTGHISTRPAPLNPLGPRLLSAVEAYSNLTTISLYPSSCHESLFMQFLEHFEGHTCLTSLKVNSSCCDEIRAPILVKIEGLSKLTLLDPRRAILQRLPEWLGRLSHSLRELHLQGNCGSITPGVLRSFIPHLNLATSISLGLSYSLMDDDILYFLSALSHCTSVQLQYYLQLRRPSQVPRLTNLRSFAVKYTRMYTKDGVNHFCRWIRRIIAQSPLQSIRLTCDDEDWRSGASVAFDSLIDHLAKRHCFTLRFLDLRRAFVGKRALKDFCEVCTNLEVLQICISERSLIEFPRFAEGLKQLHTASFLVPSIKKSRKTFIEENVHGAFDTLPVLRRLAVNGVSWESSWAYEPPSNLRLVIKGG